MRRVRGFVLPPRILRELSLGERTRVLRRARVLNVAADPENLKKLAATAGYWKTLSGNFENLKALKIPVHPAAAKYWEGRGVAVPAEVVRGY